jgi:hypothetical protein
LLASTKETFLGEGDCMKKMKIDWNNLIDAFSAEQEDYRCYLDTTSGTVLWRSVQVVENQKDKGTKDKHVVEVPSITSREGWEIMMDYLDNLNNKQLKSKLASAVQGKGAFRRFNEILNKSPSDQKRWYLFQDAAITKMLDEWLKTLDIESENTPSYHIKVGDRVRLEKPPFDKRLLDQMLFTADFLVGSENKTYLAQILKGSKAKPITAKNGNAVPGYGSMSASTINQIKDLIEKAIQTDWLQVDTSNDQDGILSHSRKGWDRIKELWSDRLLGLFNNATDQETIGEFVSVIMGRHRDIRQYFLDVLFRKAEKRHYAVIDAWKNEEVRKFKKRLQGLLRKLSPKYHSQPQKNHHQSGPRKSKPRQQTDR